jgi:hypothetical protein
MRTVPSASSSPFDTKSAQSMLNDEVAEVPFENVAVAAEPDADPFAAAPAGGEELEALLTSARQVVASLERALEGARAHERALADRLSRGKG